MAHKRSYEKRKTTRNEDNEYDKIDFHNSTTMAEDGDNHDNLEMPQFCSMDGFVNNPNNHNGGASGFGGARVTPTRTVPKQDDGHVCCKCFHGNKKWVEFTEVTTLHGLRYIWLKDASIFRRILWSSLTLLCSGVMMFQILDRAIYYYSWPVTVNVRINYNDSLKFPAVTMCNQNAFRATVADAIGQYSLITDIFDDDGTFQARDLEKYNASNTSFAELYRLAGHRKEDLIVSCQWQGKPCGPENFTEVATDHGVCYSFNLVDHVADQLMVQSPGAEDGLSLTLNVEQYEYMPGPNDAAGLKVLLHHPTQFPNVKGLGLVLPAGGHAFIGTKLLSNHMRLRLSNMPHIPRTTCD